MSKLKALCIALPTSRAAAGCGADDGPLQEDAAPLEDGPSAGITMAVALISLFTHRAVRRDVAMTGEITLRGRVLAIGGLRQKLLAAKRAGIRTVIVPAANRPDRAEVSPTRLSELEVVLVKELDEGLAHALLSPTPESRTTPPTVGLA